MNIQSPEKHHWHLILLFCGIVFISIFCHPRPSLPTQPTDLKSAIGNGGYAYKVNGQIISHRGDTSFIPASTIKILTSLSAFHFLGEHYRFTTHFLKDNAGNLYIRGQGDPFLVSENIEYIAKELRKRGLSSVTSVVLDTSYFQLESRVPGTSNSLNPYDALNSALAVNFNALPISVQKDGTILSGEPQTPLLPLMKELAISLPPGKHRLNVSGFPQKGKRSNSIRYTGELFLAFLRKAGIHISEGYRRGDTPASAKPFYSYVSPQSLSDLVAMNLTFSNNFIANQLFLSCGAKRFGGPASWKKARESITEFTHGHLGIAKNDFHIEEGSGLSRKNHLTPKAMLTILESFHPHADLLSPKATHLIKSGTLKGVYNYAGYFKFRNSLTPFILISYGEENRRDRLLTLLFQDFIERLHDHPQ